METKLHKAIPVPEYVSLVSSLRSEGSPILKDSLLIDYIAAYNRMLSRDLNIDNLLNPYPYPVRPVGPTDQEQKTFSMLMEQYELYESFRIFENIVQYDKTKLSVMDTDYTLALTPDKCTVFLRDQPIIIIGTVKLTVNQFLDRLKNIDFLFKADIGSKFFPEYFFKQLVRSEIREEAHA